MFKTVIWKSVGPKILDKLIDNRTNIIGKERRSVDASDNQRRTIEDLKYLQRNERSEKKKAIRKVLANFNKMSRITRAN